MNNNNLTINLLYSDPEGEIWRFDDLIEGEGFITPDDIDNFSDAMGGLELITDAYKVFFRSTDYHDLNMVVHFLLSGLTAMKVLDHEYFTTHYTTHEENILLSRLQHTNGSVLILEDHDNNLIKLSYQQADTSVKKGRNNFYFDNILIHESVWSKAAKIALNEYFIIRKKMEGVSKTKEASRIINAWFDYTNGEFPDEPNF
ncbi:MAG: hypothetical protein WBB45_20200 [Cyclobacteriaceae bacterium]